MPASPMVTSDPAPASPILNSLAEIHREVAPNQEGQVATYIPELAKANPDWFGICLATPGGTLYEVGDTAVPFTIQSISKPFVYGIALEDQGRTSVLQKVGVEPTGDAFNSISLEPGTGRPRNPMINAGAIATTGLVAASSPKHRAQRVLEALSRYAGRDLGFDEAVYRSESLTGHRNRAIGHMLRNFDILQTDPEPIVETYFRQCSVSVTCRDLAWMAATLANRGAHPQTGKQALRGEYVESVLGVMETCGMYDSAGRWVYEIGMPAKSGVSGGILAVLPGQVGIAVFSPRLDAQGNSVRGIHACRLLSRYLDFHLLNRPANTRLAIHRRLSGAEYGSNRVRSQRDRTALREAGPRLQCYQLQGHLTFATAETVIHDLLGRVTNLRHVILDLRRVLSLDESTCFLLHRLLLQFESLGITLTFTHSQHLPTLGRYMKRKFGDRTSDRFRTMPDNDRALEACEDDLLAGLAPATPTASAATDGMRPDFELFRGLPRPHVDRIRSLLVPRPFRSGDTLVDAGSIADEMFLLEDGRVSVLLEGAPGGDRRLATFSPGMHFGEMALLDRAPRSAKVVADTDGLCQVLSGPDLRRLERDHPEVLAGLLRNLCIEFSARLRKANAERAALD